MTGLVWIAARAYRVPAAAGVVAALVVIAQLAPRSTIPVGSPVPLRAVWFLALGCALASCLPLIGVLGHLEIAALQMRVCRAGRALASAALAVLTVVCTDAFFGSAALTTWFIALCGLGNLVAARWDEHALLVTLGVGVLSILADHLDFDAPVSQALAAIGLLLGLLWYAATCVTFVLGGLPDSAGEPRLRYPSRRRGSPEP